MYLKHLDDQNYAKKNLYKIKKFETPQEGGSKNVQKGPKGQILGVPDSTRIPDFNSVGSLERSRISRVTSGNTENASEF